MDAGPIAVKMGIEALKRTAPTGIAWVKNYFKGVDLLIVGPTNSGKTTFSDYLTYGLLEPESDHVTTLAERKSPMFSIDIGKNDTLKLSVRKALDQPGQYGPLAHANLVKEKRPHAILVMLDVTNEISDLKEWVAEFCSNLERIFIEDNKLKKRISSFVVCLNKIDKLKSNDEFLEAKSNIQSELLAGLTNALGKQRARSIPVLPCVTVRTVEHGSKFMDLIISKIAREAVQ